MQRSTAILATLTLSAGCVALGLWLPGRLALSRSGQTERPHIDDAPLGLISCERLPLKKPDSSEQTWDLHHQPYTAVVDVLDWPDLTPREVRAEQLEVPGAGSVQRIGPGRLLVSGITLGMSMVSLRAGPEDLPDRLLELATGRRNLLTQRNPVVFARNAITHCEMLVLDAVDLSQETVFHGRVYDRSTRQPLDGASVRTGKGQWATCDAEGRFAFEEPVTLQEAFSSGVGKEGYHTFMLTIRSLSVPWYREWQRTGEMIVTLAPEGRPDPPKPYSGLKPASTITERRTP